MTQFQSSCSLFLTTYFEWTVIIIKGTTGWWPTSQGWTSGWSPSLWPATVSPSCCNSPIWRLTSFLLHVINKLSSRPEGALQDSEERASEDVGLPCFSHGLPSQQVQKTKNFCQDSPGCLGRTGPARLIVICKERRWLCLVLSFPPFLHLCCLILYIRLFFSISTSHQRHHWNLVQHVDHHISVFSTRSHPILTLL